MAFKRVKEEDLEIVEDIRCNEDIAVCPGEEWQKHRIKVPKKLKINFLKKNLNRKSQFEAPLTPTHLLADFEMTEDIADSHGDCQKRKIKIFDKLKTFNFRKHQKNSKSHESEADLTTVKGTADLPGNPGKKHEMKASDKLKNVFVMKRQKNSKSCETPSGNLDQSHVEAEEHLFSSTEVASAEDKDCEIFRLRMAIYDSFSEDNQETLKSALTSVLQEKTQDQCWSEAAVDECPIWSPEKCRQIKTLLKIVVEQRMKNANERENRADKLSTSLKREVCRMGKQVQKDLLRVVRNLRECYPPDFDICRTYAQLYHEAFSTRLQELARSKVSSEECLYILSWIVDYYPNDVLKHKELEEHINSSSLGPLLPEEDLKRLEEQYFTYKENEVRKWLFTALEKEVKKWSDGIQPELMDGYYCSNLAVDVLPLVDITVSEVKALLRCENKTWCLLNQLDGFLTSYKKSLEELVKRKQKHIPKTLNANLVDIHQFRDYVQKPEHPFSEDTRTACLSTLADLKNICHTYFLSRIHKELKPLYRKLWTQVWFAGHREVVEELVKALENSIDHFKELKPVCREELLAELHVDVMVEYVRRMMKRKLKLEDKEQQEAAAEFICHNNNKICSVFAKVGSREEWLCQILPKLSEILRLQDLGSLQLEVVTLARDYPDISEQHILALLNLKTNLSFSDVCRIEGCLSENRGTLGTESSTSFFSKVFIEYQDTSCVSCYK
ncbi:tumor necrosis factor alpha-induced protein 2-like isoform X2 [Labeo rohita]|uniref:tumor necrosis factor alpha-induced protein 2-like isoform X2 n=1 Tax=Labeo rohita TaxID=84645 RepID=UPI0021E23169|nr:tumor necrosis factor alpha-induced protein 2-like isoform X2 [Labeo rohita]